MLLKKKKIRNEHSRISLLLEEAKRKYPIGTRYGEVSKNGLISSDILTISYELKFYSGLNSLKYKVETNFKEGITDGGGGWVYYNGVWADIIK